MNNKFIIDGFTWSFSRINSYAQCPKMFYMQYIECLSQTENAFSQWGTFVHLLLEKYYKKELEFFELSKAYEKGYKNNVKLKFPPNAYVDLNQSYYEAGKSYFDNFEGDFDDCEILGIEEKIKIKINNFDFVGFIDLNLKNEHGITIVDNKSKKEFKSKKELNEYLRQLYLYSIYDFEHYGEYPKKLIFNMIRGGNKIEVDFDIDELEKSKEWFLNKINEIYKDTEFKTKPDEFFCNFLCGVNTHCPCSDKYIEG